MAHIMVMQGRRLDDSDMGTIRGLLDAHPDWYRTKLSRELCALWDWRDDRGRPKDICLCVHADRWRRAHCC
jgi:hypothetical protein